VIGVKLNVFFGNVISFFALLDESSCSRNVLVVFDFGPFQSGIVSMKLHSLLFCTLWKIFERVLAMNFALYTGFTIAL